MRASKQVLKNVILNTSSPRIKRDPERLVKNEVIYFLQVLDFQCVIDNKAILSFICSKLLHFI